MQQTILVCGARGQVAEALKVASWPDGLRIVAAGRPDLDINDPGSVNHTADKFSPSLIINAAAYTAVDQAETDEEAAFRLNSEAPARLAAIAQERAIPFIHLSTDYVFDGLKEGPYHEDDAVDPKTVYGRSKREGEVASLNAYPQSIILRTAWVYSTFAKNFCKTMLRVADQRDELNVVADQIGNPTYAGDIAQAIVTIARQLLLDGKVVHPGIFNLSGAGHASWAEFAEAIFEESRALGGPSAKVNHIPTCDYPTPAARPSNSRLDCTKIADVYGVVMPSWRDSTRVCVQKLIETGAWTS